MKNRIPQPLKAVIFDLDGTLIDTAQEFVVAVQALRAEHKLPAMDPQLISASVSNGARALVSLALDINEGDPGFEQQRLHFLELYEQVLGTAATPYPGIRQLLTELGNKGIPWGIATNKPRQYAEPLVAAMNFEPACASLVCPDDVIERKPHPESLNLNCQQMRCSPPHAVYVGDHQRDIEAGRRAGMVTIAATYGYIEASDDPADWQADLYVNDSTHLADNILDN
jgi:N-acetyl-D-muramate 6-phosphate phosphatase